MLNPVALRKAKIAYHFGLSECKRFIFLESSCIQVAIFFISTRIEMGGKKEIGRAASVI